MIKTSTTHIDMVGKHKIFIFAILRLIILFQVFLKIYCYRFSITNVERDLFSQEEGRLSVSYRYIVRFIIGSGSFNQMTLWDGINKTALPGDNIAIFFYQKWINIVYLALLLRLSLFPYWVRHHDDAVTSIHETVG